MTRIKLVFWALCLGLTILWIIADPVLFGVHPFAQTQNALINYTGIIAMGAMGVSLLLALRSVAIEPHMGGLDKSYRLHKWLGVTTLVAIVAHWLLIQSPGWLTAAGVIAPPARPRGGARAPQGFAIFRPLQSPARTLGSWCFYIGLVLLVLALVRWFPYRWFLKTHRLLAIVFLILIFHAVVLLKTSYWTSPVAWVLVALMAAGAAAAIYILVQRVGRTRQAVGEVEAISSHQHGSILGVTVCLKDRWSGHEPGQFAFVDFEDGEGPHPFTISSAWKDDGRLSFLIKGLGDYTRELPVSLAKGALVSVEGPYGRFNFRGDRERQIWVSGGIGVTPFVSRMLELAAHPGDKIIDLFHATGDRGVEEVRQLRQLALAARVNLHVWVARETGPLTAAHIRGAVPEWRSSDVWFCGPVEFGKSLRKGLLAAGLPPGSFHQELFHLR